MARSLDLGQFGSNHMRETARIPDRRRFIRRPMNHRKLGRTGAVKRKNIVSLKVIDKPARNHQRPDITLVQHDISLRFKQLLAFRRGVPPEYPRHIHRSASEKRFVPRVFARRKVNQIDISPEAG
ncbi:hypothetical protein SDC9_172558 [bioreactor metagenome]|uniref:Uncharacterized protein n=1 Tax=bioreactor metagenome TaxID=1076179 RepID=A0A645GE10_9ZZZZ